MRATTMRRSFIRLLRQSLEAMQRIPGVESAAVALSVPYERGLNDGLKILDGKPRGLRIRIERGMGDARVFFETLRIPILSGRAIRRQRYRDERSRWQW